MTTNHHTKTRNIGPCINILQLNIEGISKSKSEYTSRLAIENDVDVILVQEIHTDSSLQINERGHISGFHLTAHTLSRTYGVATYIRNRIENYHVVSSSTDNNIHMATVVVNGLTIVNVYKPPNESWPDPPISALPHPSIVAGDFNSHHTSWGYSTNDRNGDHITEWADLNRMYLVYDAKDIGTFRSARWQRDYTPDLSFVSINSNNEPLPTSRKVLKSFPHSQHRPIILNVGVQIPIIASIEKPRWNFGKASWWKYSKEVDANIRWIEPIKENYGRFVKMILSTAKKSIPRGYRKEYIPGWSNDIEKLFNDFENSGDPEIADELLNALTAARKEKWEEKTKNIDFTHSSRKSWKVLRKLGAASNPVQLKSNMKPDTIATRIVKISNGVSLSKRRRRFVKNSLKRKKRRTQISDFFSRPFELHEVETAIRDMKSGKAAGNDKIFPEFLIHLGMRAKKWITAFMNDLLDKCDIPPEFRYSKVLAILKPGKTDDKPENFRPIALLSTTYKLLERLIYNRIYPTINEILPPEQAGFRENRSCNDQVLALTTFIEAGFERNQKTGVVLIDLSSAYDTVWKDALLLKLLDVIPCKKLISFIGCMLTNRRIRVYVNDGSSRTRTLNNGLPQGSVLAPLLFNLYISDMPPTVSRKFAYADDNAIGVQDNNPEIIEDILTADLQILDKYYTDWRLCPNEQKTEICFFHLNHREANLKLVVPFRNKILEHNNFPTYLGKTMDRTLTDKTHLEKLAQKLKSRNNILHKLAGTSWGCNGITLRTAALALVYSTAEYCCSAWLNSAHVNKIDIQLNETMRIVSGAIQSTPLEWLPVMSNIAPTHLRRKAALQREFNKIENNLQLPIHQDLNDIRGNYRLVSRFPIWKEPFFESSNDLNLIEEWKSEWNRANVRNKHIIDDPTIKLNGFGEDRKTWATINRIRSGHGRTRAMLNKWDPSISPSCDCGALFQTMNHIIGECPRRRFSGDITELNNLTPAAIEWLKNLDIEL